MVCSRRAPGSQITVDAQWHHEAGGSLLPHTGHQTSGLPKCCIVLWLSIPSWYTSHQHQASASSVCLWQTADPTVEVKKIYHHLSLNPSGEQKGEKRGQKIFTNFFLTSYSDKVGPRQVDPVACLGALSCLPARSCSLLHIRYNKVKA